MERETFASIYRVNDTIIVHSNTLTTAGFWVAAPPFVTLAQDTTASAIGEQVLRAFAACQYHAPIPTEMKIRLQPLWQAAGVKSLKQLERTGIHCAVSGTARTIEIIPSHSEGKGFLYAIENKIVLARDATAEEIGAAVQQGLARCTRFSHNV